MTPTHSSPGAIIRNQSNLKSTVRSRQNCFCICHSNDANQAQCLLQVNPAHWATEHGETVCQVLHRSATYNVAEFCAGTLITVRSLSQTRLLGRVAEHTHCASLVCLGRAILIDITAGVMLPESASGTGTAQNTCGLRSWSWYSKCVLPSDKLLPDCLWMFVLKTLCIAFRCTIPRCSHSPYRQTSTKLFKISFWGRKHHGLDITSVAFSLHAKHLQSVSGSTCLWYLSLSLLRSLVIWSPFAFQPGQSPTPNSFRSSRGRVRRLQWPSTGTAGQAWCATPNLKISV